MTRLIRRRRVERRLRRRVDRVLRSAAPGLGEGEACGCEERWILGQHWEPGCREDRYRAAARNRLR